MVMVCQYHPNAFTPNIKMTVANNQHLPPSPIASLVPLQEEPTARSIPFCPAQQVLTGAPASSVYPKPPNLTWCGMQRAAPVLGSITRAIGLVAPRHVGSSQARARTHVPCIGRQILNHCATREAPVGLVLIPGVIPPST
ncbi:hypothetical protein J1605_016573 [Eschrichtius robustus]|uniref:Uncharacterized protein n=1 Tax=Eschrichtius robustus TaxID=9764 RepID=A0AB34I6Z9_ESCRO|nr:hypothetical protein J1605_016573 [Eschrichtius robustus]